MLRRTVIAFVSAACLWAARVTPAAFDAARYLSHVRYLSSPEMKGRANASPELERAAKYISAEFKAAGLKPSLQAFELTATSSLGVRNQIRIRERGKDRDIASGSEFVPFSFSSAGTFSGAVVFAGYGITAPEYSYDDYEKINAAGRFVVVLAHEPEEFSADSVFEGKTYTWHSEAYAKALNARKHGALGVIVIFDRFHHPDDREEMERFATTAGAPDAGIPVVQISDKLAAPWFEADGENLPEVEASIDRYRAPRSRVLTGVEIQETIAITRTVRTVHNVVAYLPGETDDYVVIGAHYDHLGLGEQFSMAPSKVGKIHPGADDNASGTAGILELARWFAGHPKPRKGILFLAFAGEELGMLGSEYYVEHPLLPLAHAVAMINLDMIGRIRDGRVFVGGSPRLRDAAIAAAAGSDFRLDTSGGVYGSSDHTVFIAGNIPVLFFFSGLHGDYHKPGDTWDKIDPDAAVSLLRLVANVASGL